MYTHKSLNVSRRCVSKLKTVWFIVGWAVKCQHCLLDKVYPPDFQQQEEKSTANIKHALTFGWRQPGAAPASGGGAAGEEPPGGISKQIVSLFHD